MRRICLSVQGLRRNGSVKPGSGGGRAISFTLCTISSCLNQEPNITRQAGLGTELTIEVLVISANKELAPN